MIRIVYQLLNDLNQSYKNIAHNRSGKNSFYTKDLIETDMNLRYLISLFYSLSYTHSLYIYYGWPFGPAKGTLSARGRRYLVVAYGHNLIKSFDSK